MFRTVSLSLSSFSICACLASFSAFRMFISCFDNIDLNYLVDFLYILCLLYIYICICIYIHHYCHYYHC